MTLSGGSLVRGRHHSIVQKNCTLTKKWCDRQPLLSPSECFLGGKKYRYIAHKVSTKVCRTGSQSDMDAPCGTQPWVSDWQRTLFDTLDSHRMTRHSLAKGRSSPRLTVPVFNRKGVARSCTRSQAFPDPSSSFVRATAVVVAQERDRFLRDFLPLTSGPRCSGVFSQ